MPTTHTVARDLLRSVPFQVVRDSEASEEGDGWTLTGYAVTFGQPTEIDSWEGRFFESVRKGAFRKTFREQTPVCQFDHGRHPLIGSIPIGAFRELYEDDQGVFVNNRITENWLMQPVRDAIAEGSITGMSFRFEVVREQWTDAQGKVVRPEEVAELLWAPGDRGPLHRELIEVRCRELGPVVFPAYASTSVSVRARDVADGLAHDDDMTRRIRHSLARDAATAVPNVPDDPQLRREVAAALLFQRPGQQPRGEHLVIDLARGVDPEEVGRTVADRIARMQADTAPLTPEHPHGPDTTTLQGAPLTEHPPTPRSTDAPPADGHPSPSRTERMRPQLAEIGALMDGVLASIDTKENS